MGPFQRTPKWGARDMRYSGLGVRSVGSVGDFLETMFPIFTDEKNPRRRPVTILALAIATIGIGQPFFDEGETNQLMQVIQDLPTGTKRPNGRDLDHGELTQWYI